MTIEDGILTAGLLLSGAIFSTQMAGKLGLPTLLLFLLLGMVAGSEGVGKIDFSHPVLARNFGVVALAIILFTGGLNSDWQSIRPVILPGITLATAGVVVTTLVLGLFVKYFLGSYSSFDIGPVGLSWRESFLVAALVSSTDSAAVFSIFRRSPVQPQPKLRTLLEFESGSNDPMAILLTFTLLETMRGAAIPAATLLWSLARQVAVGTTVGLLLGLLGASAANRLRLAYAELYPTLVLSVGLLAFGLANKLGGNGFLAVYCAGLLLGNRLQRARSEVLQFHNGLSWLIEIALFVLLGLLVLPSQLAPVAVTSLALALFLMLVARPLAVLTCLLPLRQPLNQLGYISWVGLRGSVPIVLATFPASYGIPHAEVLFHLVFFVVLASIMLQGATLVPATKLFRVTFKPPQ